MVDAGSRAKAFSSFPTPLYPLSRILQIQILGVSVVILKIGMLLLRRS